MVARCGCILCVSVGRFSLPHLLLYHTHTQHTHTQFAFIYIFNLIIGVGALSLPRAFSEAGLVLGTILIIVLCGMSLMTATYMVEAMAAANAYSKLGNKRKVAVKSSDIQRHDEVSSIIQNVDVYSYQVLCEQCCLCYS